MSVTVHARIHAVLTDVAVLGYESLFRLLFLITCTHIQGVVVVQYSVACTGTRRLRRQLHGILQVSGDL